MRRPDHFRTAGWALAALSTAAILLLTLRPASGAHLLHQPIFCVLCGRYGLANVLRNVVLFAPLGLGLGLALDNRIRAFVLPGLLSAGIETAQLFVPGRNPLLVDLAANTAGGILGVVLAVGLLARTAPGGAARRPRLVTAHAMFWLGISAATLVGTAWAFTLDPPEPPHHVQFTPRLGHLAPYRGVLHAARLGEEPLRPGRHPRPEELVGRLLGGEPLRLEIEPAPPPSRLAPILSVYTGARQELFLVGARGDDLVLRLPYRAVRLRLDRPDLRLPGAMPRPGEADRVEVEARVRPPGEAGTCLRAAGQERCGLRPTAGEGWALLLFPGGISMSVRRGLGLAWLAALGFVPALFVGSAPAAAAVGIALVAAAAGAPPLLGSLARPPLWELAALLLGTALGFLAGRALEARGRGRPGATPVAAPQRPPG